MKVERVRECVRACAKVERVRECVRSLVRDPLCLREGWVWRNITTKNSVGTCRGQHSPFFKRSRGCAQHPVGPAAARFSLRCATGDTAGGPRRGHRSRRRRWRRCPRAGAGAGSLSGRRRRLPVRPVEVEGVPFRQAPQFRRTRGRRL